MTVPVRAAIAACLLAACGDGDRPTPEPPVRAAVEAPAPGPAAEPVIDAALRPTMNQRIVAIAEGYAEGGGYAWPAPKGTQGTRSDLEIGGERLARGTGGPTHCSGLTFEIFWRALQERPGAVEAAGLDADKARKLMRTWYVPTDGGAGPAEALPEAGLGRRIEDLEEARPGDFVQVWFNNGRGHTMIFLDWERDADGRITGMKHFSSHPSTDGIGVTTRAIGDGTRDIDRSKIYIARATAPDGE